MVVYPAVSACVARLATLEDMFSDDAAPKAKRKGPKFSHYRRNRVSKAPRKRTFIMHMTKYPDAWISALCSPKSSGSPAGLQGGFCVDSIHAVSAVQGAEPFAIDGSDHGAVRSDINLDAAVSVPIVKRRVSPFAIASAAALQICDEESSIASVQDAVVVGQQKDAAYNLLALCDEPAEDSAISTPEGKVIDDCSSISEQQLVLLGAGGQGSVYKGQLNGETVAFKFPLIESQDGMEDSSLSNLKSFEREVAVLTMYQHLNIVSCLGVWKEGPRPYLVEEYAARGSLHDWLYTKDINSKAETLAVLATRAISQHCSSVMDDLVEPLSALTLQTATASVAGTTLKWQDWSACNLFKYIAILQGLLDVSSGLAHLHGSSPQVVHRDLKPDNVLLTIDGVAKLADFGVAKILVGNSLEATYELFGTANYAAPEDLWGSPDVVGPAADIYSLGCIAWECLAGERPWMGCSEYSIMFAVGQGTRHLPLPDSWPSGLKALLTKCLAYDVSIRPDATAVCSILSAELQWATQSLVATLSKY